MAYVLALLSAGFYGAADFTGGIATRPPATIPVVLISQAAGLVLVALALPLMPAATPRAADLWWGAAAGLAGGGGGARAGLPPPGAGRAGGRGGPRGGGRGVVGGGRRRGWRAASASPCFIPRPGSARWPSSRRPPPS